MWQDKLNIITTYDIREKRIEKRISLIPDLNKKIREVDIEIVKLTSHRDSLKKELKEAKQEIDKNN